MHLYIKNINNNIQNPFSRKGILNGHLLFRKQVVNIGINIDLKGENLFDPTTPDYFLPIFFSLLKKREEGKENEVANPVLNHIFEDLIDFQRFNMKKNLN